MDEKIVVRPPSWLWSGVLLFGFVGASICWMGFTVPHRSSKGDLLFPLFMGGLMLILSAITALYIARERIEADAQRIRWQGAFHKWQSASWGEISDFYDANGDDSRQDRSVVIFQDGRKLTFNAYLEGFFALKNAITQRVITAGKTEWESRDLKGGSTPASATASKGAVGFMTGCFAALSLCMWWMALWLPIGRMLNPSSPGSLDIWGWAMIITLELFCLPLLSLSIIGLVTQIRTERPRTVHFNEEGFYVEEKGRAPWQARWDEITAVKQCWNGRRIEAPYGVFYATTALNHYRAFTEVMDANLPAQLQKSLETPIIHEGDIQVFRYISASNRTMVLFPILMGGQLPLAHVLYSVCGLEFRPENKPADWIIPYSVCDGLILLGGWGLWRMYAARIEVSDSGITQVGLNGTTKLRWTDIERGRVIGSDSLAWCELSGAGQRVRWWAGLPNGKLLHEEITRRLPENITIDWK